VNGWWRLGLVIASLCAFFAGVIGYQVHDSARLWSVRPSAATLALRDPQKKIDAIWFQFRGHADLADCVQSKTKVSETYPYGEGRYDIDCQTSSATALWGAIKYAAIPFIALWILGTVIAWVYRGFRPPA
jgi:hypothetical protein